MTISINNNITIKSLSIKCITVIFLFLATNQYCFSQDNLNEEELIEFNFITKSFNKSLPFDQFFSIKLLEIPDDSTDIAIRFYEYDLKAYRKLNFSMGSTVTQDQLKGALKIYEMTWERQSYSTDKTAEIPIPYLLKPNLKYIIEIKQTKKDKLSTEQKNTLAADLKSDLEISNLITNIGLEHLTVTNTIPSFANLDEYQAKINDFASRIVLKTNRYYRVDAIVLPHLIEISTYAKKFENIKFDLDNFSNNEVVDLMKDLTKKENIISDINAFKDKLSEINWGKVEPSDADFLALSFLKDKIFTAFPESDLQINSVKEEKLSIEEFIETILSQRDALLKIITDNIIADNTYISSTLDATYRTDFAKNAKLYITLDVGAAYVFGIDKILSYSGVNFYLRPVNKNIPLRNYTGWDWVKVRTSFLIGITMNSIEKTDVRKGLFGTSALVLGAGIRPVPFLKINGGCFIYYSNSTNPLFIKERYHTTFSPFVSLSIDLDAKSLFSGIGEAIFK